MVSLVTKCYHAKVLLLKEMKTLIRKDICTLMFMHYDSTYNNQDTEIIQLPRNR